MLPCPRLQENTKVAIGLCLDWSYTILPVWVPALLHHERFCFYFQVVLGHGIIFLKTYFGFDFEMTVNLCLFVLEISVMP